VVGGRKYDLQMRCSPLEHLEQYKCVLIVIDHSSYAYARIVDEARLVANTLSDESILQDLNIVRC
jgi:UDP-N-acetyl-D-glucosamine dehydrogenase